MGAKNRVPTCAILLALIAVIGPGALAAGPLASEPLVDVHGVDPTILIELRYATPRNLTGRALYPPDQPCLLRAGVAKQLVIAEAWLKLRGFRLKIWDAWRPVAVQELLWKLKPDGAFVARPTAGHALHTWGVAVDVTLVDLKGRPVTMPTDFDAFTTDASLRYRGVDADIRAHLATLQRAMATAGFLGMSTEWWHFLPKNFRDYDPK